MSQSEILLSLNGRRVTAIQNLRFCYDMKVDPNDFGSVTFTFDAEHEIVFFCGDDGESLSWTTDGREQREFPLLQGTEGLQDNEFNRFDLTEQERWAKFRGEKVNFTHYLLSRYGKVVFIFGVLLDLGSVRVSIYNAGDNMKLEINPEIELMEIYDDTEMVLIESYRPTSTST